jgi:molecular chaperone DnaK (HSP70)
MEGLQRVLAAADISNSMVDNVLLTGGSTQIPRIQQLIRDFFDQGTNRRFTICARVAAPKGAFRFARAIANDTAPTEILPPLPFNQLSLGILGDDGKVAVLIPRNARLPAEATAALNATEAIKRIQIYQENDLLDEFAVNGMKANQCILVTFKVAFNQSLEVSAQTEGSHQRELFLVISPERRFADAQIEKVMNEAKEMDRLMEERQRIQQLDELKDELSDWCAKVASTNGTLSQEEKDALSATLNDAVIAVQTRSELLELLAPLVKMNTTTKSTISAR